MAPPPVDMHYIDFLKAAVAETVEIVLAEDAMHGLARERADREKASDALVERLETLGKAAIAAMESVANQPADSHAARIRDSVVKAAQAAVVREVVEVKRQLTREVEENKAVIADQQRRVMRAIEALILHQDLGEAAGEVHIALRPDLTYSAGWLSRTDYGVEFLVELRVDANGLLGRDLRVSQLSPALEIHAPELAGWIRKQTKMVGHRLDRYHVVGIAASAKRTKMMLRTAADAQSPGFDITINRESRAVEIARSGELSESFDVDPGDVPALLGLGDQLAEAAGKLRSNRSGLLQASIGGTALDALDRPSQLVEQIVAAMAPIVHQIARSSPPDELVLRRQLGDNRREELFVTKAELLAQINRLPEARRGVFAPLSLDRAAPEPTMSPAAMRASSPNAEAPPEQDGGWDLESTAVILLKKGLPPVDLTAPPAGDTTPEAAELDAPSEDVDIDLASEVKATPLKDPTPSEPESQPRDG